MLKKIRKKSALLPELITDILLCLPVSSLIRFRCLSTSLCNEIDSENFIKNHLSRSIQRKTCQKLIVDNPYILNRSAFYFANFDDDLVDAFPLNKPSISRHRPIYIYGSCNGLILLGMDSMDFKVKCQTMDLVIWNPFTRRHKKLPLCPVQTLPGYRGFMCSGLGYDSAHDDYKIVLISKVHDSNGLFSQVWVFGLKSDFWRRSRDLEDEVNIWVGRFANGALYWVCEIKCIGFDVTEEVFFDIPLPYDRGVAAFFFNPLVVFRGKVYLSKLHDKTVELYLLVSDKGGEDVGVSWRKEFTIENVKTILHDIFPLWPLAYSKDGDSILLGDIDGVFWHNLENKTNQRVNFAGVPELLHVYRYNVCWEILVSVGKDSAFDEAAEEVIIDDLEGVEQFEGDFF